MHLQEASLQKVKVLVYVPIPDQVEPALTLVESP
jgi:hypothetical protein